MTDISKEAVTQMLEGVTDGPWEVDGPPWNQIIWSSAENRVAFMAHSNGMNDDRDIKTARFIAYAREAVPALSAERDALEADVTTYQEIVKDLTAERDGFAMQATGLSADNARVRSIVEAAEARVAELTADQERLSDALFEEGEAYVAAQASNAALTAEVERLRHLRDVVASGPLRGQLMEVWIENVMERAAALHDRPTEYEVKLSQLKEDFPNGV